MAKAPPGSAQIAAHITALRRYARVLVRDADQAEDLVQDTLERALRKLHLWKPGNLRAWLMTIMHNVRVNQATARSVLVFVDNAEIFAQAPQGASVADLIDARRAFQRLAPIHQEAIVQAALHESTVELAHCLKVPTGTALSRLSRGRDQMRRLMDRE
jgi:DNA-directed RNA polymerase specialized sigma24 family protein